MKLYSPEGFGAANPTGVAVQPERRTGQRVEVHEQTFLYTPLEYYS